MLRGVRRLVPMHFSQHYEDTMPFLQQAQAVVQNVVALTPG